MNGSRIAAVLIVVGVGVYLGSGRFGGAQSEAPPVQTAAVEQQAPLFRVAVAPVAVEPHAKRVVLSGRTEADKRGNAMARVAGVVLDLKVRRGARVKTGDVVAVLSDEARESAVAQAQARLEQRRTEFNARIKLIESGTLAAINRPQLEAEMRAAEAALALAEAERDKGKVLAPITGVVTEVPIEVGQALQSNAVVAEMVALSPMLAVVEIAERQLGGVKVGDKAQVRLVTGQTAEGAVRFISPRASPQTRTYRVEVGLENVDGQISDGVTAEVTLFLAPVQATKVPRSALTFSSEGRLGVRIVEAGDTVRFVPVGLVEDGVEALWVSGLETGQRLIVQGQDFVRDGVKVEPVSAVARAG